MERKNEVRKSLDDGGRFGFMGRGKDGYCVQCTKPINKGESRIYDNQQRLGPYCLPCAQRMLHSAPSASNSNELSEKGTKILSDIAGFILEQTNKLKAIEEKHLKTNQILTLILAKLNGPENQQNFTPPAPPRDLGDVGVDLVAEHQKWLREQAAKQQAERPLTPTELWLQKTAAERAQAQGAPADEG